MESLWPLTELAQIVALTILNVVILVLTYWRTGAIWLRQRAQERHLQQVESDLSDLLDRFVRYQKRETMRAVRAEKDKTTSTIEQAKVLLAGQGQDDTPADTKAALRAKVRRMT